MSEITNSNAAADNPALLKSKRVNALHCLLIPLQDEKLLLPNTAVAEIISYTNPEPIENSPEWLRGKIIWRDVSVPLVSFELLSGLADSVGGTRRIAVLNTLNGDPHVPYIGILIQGIPQLRLVQDDNIFDEDLDEEKIAVVRAVKINEEQVLIPDIDEIESRLKQLL